MIKPTEADIENVSYNYQKELTNKLDAIDSDFDQNVINEIVLWKTNRYSWIDDKTLSLINQIKKNDKDLRTQMFIRLLINEYTGFYMVKN